MSYALWSSQVLQMQHLKGRGSLEVGCLLAPVFLPQVAVSVKALQLAAQAFSTAAVTPASAHACLLTLSGRTASDIAFTVRTRNCAEPVLGL